MKSLLVATLLLVPPVLALAPAAPTELQDPTLADLAWIAGHWSAETGGARTEEAWLAPGGGLMLGVHRDTPAKGRAFFEYLRIEARDDGLVYVASPGGKGATDFPLADYGEDFVLFENPEHDFPRTLHYELDQEGRLNVRAAGVEGGKERAQEWTWSREP